MQLRYEIPDTFWSLFRSVNREIYMESLLVINEEYQYSNYFLTKEICVQVLSDMNAQKQVLLQREENETDFDMLETTASRILRWLLKTGWLKKIEDYSTMTTNIRPAIRITTSVHSPTIIYCLPESVSSFS